jgi:hypothetical protein
MPADRKPIAGAIAAPIAVASDTRPPATRSAVTNGKRWLGGVDMRSSAARRWKDLVYALTTDLGGNLSTAEAAMVWQAATLLLRVEATQSAVVRGDKIDDEETTRTIHVTQRVLESLGLSRKREEAETRAQLEAFQAARRSRYERSRT